MTKYCQLNFKLSNSQLHKLKSAVKNKTGVTLQINIKMIDGNKLPYELFLTARQKNKIKNLKTKYQLI